MMIEWQWLSFNELTTQMLYDVLQLRQAVFQVEQQSIYQDCDDLDQKAQHLLGYQNNKLIAYLRINHRNHTILISRIVINKQNRGKGLGKELVQQGLQYINRKFPNTNIQISAQMHLEKFYNQFGFVGFGAPTDDAGIKHIKMELQR